MKYWLIVFFSTICLSASAQIPDGFVEVRRVIPDLYVELRYFGSNNFIGQPIDGYYSDKLIVTKQTANAIKLVQKELQNKNLCLKVYDGYRPQRAVNHFVNWAKDLNDTINKSIFYPNLNKQDLFLDGYIAYKSGHSRGSTLDLTIVDGNTGEPIDMGSSFDFFGEESWVDYEGVSKEQKANRKFLQNIMLKYGFKNYPKEWWHFTLINEPFPNTYFNFPIE